MKKIIISFIFLNFCNYLKPDDVKSYLTHYELLQNRQQFNRQEIADMPQIPVGNIDEQSFRAYIAEFRAVGNNQAANIIELAMHNMQEFNHRQQEGVITIPDIIRFIEEGQLLIRRLEAIL
jgi:hypothetical protein